jgi:hypothetical protein
VRRALVSTSFDVQPTHAGAQIDRTYNPSTHHRGARGHGTDRRLLARDHRRVQVTECNPSCADSDTLKHGSSEAGLLPAPHSKAQSPRATANSPHLVDSYEQGWPCPVRRRPRCGQPQRRRTVRHPARTADRPSRSLTLDQPAALLKAVPVPGSAPASRSAWVPESAPGKPALCTGDAFDFGDPHATPPSRATFFPRTA